MFWLELAAFPREADLERDGWRQWRDSVSPGVLESRAELWSFALVAWTGSWLQSVPRWQNELRRPMSELVSKEIISLWAKVWTQCLRFPCICWTSGACSAPRTAPRRFSRILCLAPLLLKIVWACWPTLVLKEAEAPKQAQFQHELIFPLSNIQFLKLYESQFVFLEEQELSAILHKIVIRYHYLYGRQPCSLTHSTVGIQYLSCAGHCPN